MYHDARPGTILGAGALAAALPVLAGAVAVNLFGVSPSDWFTTAPSAAIARRDAQDAVDAMVQGIEGFRDDYAELPEHLAEVAASSPGIWTYSRTPGGGYHVALERHGHTATFASVPARR